MAGSYKIVVKNGDSKYLLNDGKYEFVIVDYVLEFDSLIEALGEFLSWVDLETGIDKTSLVYVPEKVKKGKGKDK